MTTYSDLQVWIVIAGLAIGTFLLRYSFLGFVGEKALPPFLARMLRYTSVAVLPALLAPMIVWPAATQGVTDPARLLAALAALAVGVWKRNLLLTIIAGMGALYVLRWLMH